MSGSVRGVRSNAHSYRDTGGAGGHFGPGISRMNSDTVGMENVRLLRADFHFVALQDHLRNP